MSISAVIKKVRCGKLQRVDFNGRVGEVHIDRELWQHYGHASWPLPGAEGVVVFEGDVNVAHMIADRDRRYIPAFVAPGEVASYTDEGDFIWFKRGNQLYIYSKKNVFVQSDGDIAATAKGKITGSAPEIDMTATAKIVLTAPEVFINGALNCAAEDGVSATTCNLKGSLVATGDLEDKVRKLDDDRGLAALHTHGGVATGAGNTGVPNQTE
jgi:phage gp45-like